MNSRSRVTDTSETGHGHPYHVLSDRPSYGGSEGNGHERERTTARTYIHVRARASESERAYTYDGLEKTRAGTGVRHDSKTGVRGV